MPPLTTRALAELLSTVTMSLPGAAALPSSIADPLDVADAVSGQNRNKEVDHYSHLPEPSPAEVASLGQIAASHLLSLLPSYVRDQAPTPFLVAAGDSRCPHKVKDKLRTRSTAINAATEQNKAFVIDLIKMLESKDFSRPLVSGPGFFPMSRFVPTVASAACKPGSYDSVETLMGHLSRDWSDEHQWTGGKSYDIIIRMLEKHVPVQKGSPPPRVLLPGGGLGRLAFDLAKRGYHVEMNDCSPVMAAVAHAILSNFKQHKPCFPFLHRWKNLLHGDERDQLTMMDVPNVPPGIEAGTLRAQGTDILPIDITLGDFGRLYSTPPNDTRLRAVGGGFDACILSFFIDKSNSDTWQALLEVALPVKPGGLLINAGPLAWKGDARPMLTMDEVLAFWQEHPKTRMEVVERDMIPIDYSRREGALLYGERYITPIIALRKGAAVDDSIRL